MEPYSPMLSSSLFSLAPYICKVPNEFNLKLNIMSTVSTQYHVYDYYSKKYNVKNKWLTRISECLDGVGIILVCNSFIFNKCMRNSINNIDKSIILFYVSSKLTSNIEIVKHHQYFISLIKSSLINPKILLPWALSITGLRDYFRSGLVWNTYNRIVWHVGTTLYLCTGSEILLRK